MVALTNAGLVGRREETEGGDFTRIVEKVESPKWSDVGVREKKE